MTRSPPPLPHLRLKSVAGQPLPEAFEAALAARLAEFEAYLRQTIPWPRRYRPVRCST